MGLSLNRTGAIALLGIVTLAELCFSGINVGPVLGNEIQPDQTLGNESSTLRQVNDRRTEIEGGAVRGRHLFHSFREFSIRELQEVYFTNPAGIEAILGRITGDRRSQIFGTLGVDGDASLFLLNPNGFVFGENAVLDIRGSFVASTSDRFEFANGLDFSATRPDAPPLLTVDLPVGVQLGESALGDIDSLAQLSAGRDLTLAGQDVAVQGSLIAGGDVTIHAASTLQVRDQAEQPFIASAAGRLELQGDAQLDIFALNHPDSYVLAGETLTLRSSTPVIGDGRFQSGDAFQVETLDERPGDLRSPNDPVIRSAGDVTLNTYEGTSLHILSGGRVSANTITVTGAAPGTIGGDFLAETVPLSNGGSVDINGGDRPTVDIRAGMNPIDIQGPSGLTGIPDVVEPVNPTLTTGTGSDIRVDSINVTSPNGQVLLTNQYRADSSLPEGMITIGTIRTDDQANGFEGNGGDVTIDGRGDVAVNERVVVSSATGNPGSIEILNEGVLALDASFLVSINRSTGTPGNVFLQTGSLSAVNGAQIRVSSAGLSDAGRVDIFAQDTVTFDGMRNQTRSGRSGVVNSVTASPGSESVTSGGIFIQAGDITLTNGAQLQSRIEERARGVSGDIQLTTPGTLRLEGVSDPRFRASSSAIITSLERNSIGQAGDVLVQAGVVELVDGGQIQTNTIGEGNAGDVSIAATESVSISGSERDRGSFVISRINDGGTGDGGNVRLEAPVIEISDTGIIQSGTEIRGRGNGGDITLVAPTQLTIRDNARVTSLVDDFGRNAGDILIETGLFELSENSSIQAQADGNGDGGDVTLRATGKVSIFDDAQIRSSQGDDSVGNAGDIRIEARSVEISDSVISSSSNARGNSGSITVISDEGVRFLGGSVLRSILEDEGTGTAGDILIDAGSIVASEDVAIEARTRGRGDGGNITLRGQDLIDLQSADVISSVERRGVGNAGNVLFEAREFFMANSSIQSNTLGVGDAGNVEIRASDRVAIEDSRLAILSRVNSRAVGDGGDVRIETNEFSLTGESGIFSRSEGTGDAGNVRLIARTEALFQGVPLGERCFVDCENGIFSSVSVEGRGRAGQIRVDAGQLTVEEGARIDATTAGIGSAGNITIRVDDLNVNNRGVIATSTLGAFNAGRIDVEATQSISVTNDGVVTSSVEPGATGDGGSISLVSPVLRLSQGGRVEVQSQGFVEFDERIYSEGIQGDRPVAYWSFNEAANEGIARDQSGNELTGVYEEVNPGDVQSIPDGVSGSAVQFNGESGAILIGSVEEGSPLDLNEQSFTIEAWLRPADPPPEQQVYFSLHSANQRLESLSLRISESGRYQVSYFGNSLNADNAIRFGTDWQHVVAQYDQENDRSFAFVNGRRVDSGSDGPFRGESSIARIGNWRSNIDRTFNGAIDEVAVYRAVLTGDQIENHYLRGISAINSAAGLNPEARARAGNISIEVDQLDISGTSQDGNTSSGLFSGTEGVASGAGGNIGVDARTLSISDGGVISAVTQNQSRGGRVSLSVAEAIALENGGQVITNATESATGQAGQILVREAGRLTIEGALVSSSGEQEIIDGIAPSGLFASTDGAAQGGNIAVDIPGNVILRNDGTISASTSGSGDGGTIEASARNVRVRNDAQILASTSGAGQGGAIDIDVENQLYLQNGGTISASTSGSGRGGRVLVTANQVHGIQGGQIAASASGTGDGGVIRVDASDQIRFSGQQEHNGETTPSGIFSTAERGSTGSGGRIAVVGDRLLLDDRGQISATTFGEGEGGDIRATANQITVQRRSAIEANTTRRREGGGNGGSIEVNAEEINLDENGQISTSSTGRGDAGGIVLNEVDRLRLRSGASIAATTSLEEDGGMGGTIEIAARRIHVLENSTISASTEGSGTGGQVSIEADEVEVFDGGQILTSTAGSGDAGNLELLVTEFIDVAGEESGLLANTTRRSLGNGGNVVIDPELVVVRNGAEIGVSSEGQGQGGSVDITAERLEVRNGGRILANNSGLEPGGDILLNTGILLLEERATISASTASVDGGNIEISADERVVMRQGSRIRTDAGEGDEGIGNGGNIAIATTLLITVLSENNDISANAVQGQGGSVEITAPLGIYGIVLREEPTPLSDITVSSTFGSSGSVILNTPDVDPNRGTSELPSGFVRPGFNQVCQANGSADSSRFVDTGRGGVPLSADAALSSLGGVWDDGRSLNEALQTSNRRLFISHTATSPHEAVNVLSSPTVEAQGWEIHRGQLILTAQSVEVVPYSSLQMPLACGEMSATSHTLERSHAPSTESAVEANNLQPQEELE